MSTVISPDPLGRRIKCLVYRGVEAEPYLVVYCDEEPVSAVKSRRVRAAFNPAKVEAFLNDWRDWKRQTVGRHIECQRDHLRQGLTHFTKRVICVAITLARVGGEGRRVPFREAYAETKKYLEGRDPENVLFEYYDRFEELVQAGMELVRE